MTRTLHWFLLSGCVALISMFGPLAWQSLQVFRLSVDVADFAGGDGRNMDRDVADEGAAIARAQPAPGALPEVP